MAHLKVLKRLETLEEGYAVLMAKHVVVMAANERLCTKVSRLEAKLASHKVKKDSKTSSILPSQDPLRKKNISLRMPSGKK